VGGGGATALRERGGDATFLEADVREEADIERLFERTVERHGRVDVLVNNAGVQAETSVTDLSTEEWDRVLETDFRSFWLCASHAAEHMPDGASIVNVSSNHAFVTMPNLFPYNAVKAGINGMTRAMALDLGPTVRVNTVNPGWIAVERTVGDMSDERRHRLESIHPVGRIGTPEDVAAVVSFLASEEAGFVTGTAVTVDGGRTAVMQDDTLPDYADPNEE
jgi:NAD(P)-dependent dehydrogenase (short-subunit alcohol dehydrogenase family)